MIVIPRQVRRNLLSVWKCNFNYFACNFNFIIPNILMDRVEKILIADNDIEKKIMALRSEVSDVEARILDNILIERLEKENRELEEELQKYRKELIDLESANGRLQVAYSNVFQNSKGDDMNSTKETISNVCKKEQPKVSENVTKADEVANKAEKKKDKEQKKAQKTESKDTKKTGSGDDPAVDVGRLDLRVGKIVHIEKHPDADSLYVEKVDIGQQQPITVVSGLVKHIPIEQMQDSLVIILANLKPAKMRGITSEGMVMCASIDGVVEVLRPPPDSLPGEVVSCPGYPTTPDPVLNPKKKVFETVAPDLKTDDEVIATYKGARWSVESKGFVKAQTLKGANIK